MQLKEFRQRLLMHIDAGVVFTSQVTGTLTTKTNALKHVLVTEVDV